jgi:hypothetical protein
MVANLARNDQKEPSEEDGNKLNKTKKKSNLLPVIQEGTIHINKVPEAILTNGVSNELLKILITNEEALSLSKSESKNREYLLRLAEDSYIQVGKKEGREQAEEEIKRRNIINSKLQAQEWFEGLGEYFNSFIILLGYIEEKEEAARQQIIDKVKQILIKEAKTQGIDNFTVLVENKEVFFKGLFSIDNTVLDSRV